MAPLSVVMMLSLGPTYLSGGKPMAGSRPSWTMPAGPRPCVRVHTAQVSVPGLWTGPSGKLIAKGERDAARRQRGAGKTPHHHEQGSPVRQVLAVHVRLPWGA
mmetsp:Transcript_30996/g.82368  ORF Transcript_30996/g.82368 Transcript_30996/m.82368 type:complete len:103 (-) Transcript_30996:143-451(-)